MVEVVTRCQHSRSSAKGAINRANAPPGHRDYGAVIVEAKVHFLCPRNWRWPCRRPVSWPPAGLDERLLPTRDPVCDSGNSVGAERPGHLGVGETMSDSVSLDALMLADSPRLDGEDPKHVELLAGAGAHLPPVLVHRSTMRVIDGTHRILAARLRGDSEISITYFDGTDFEAFVQSVQSNVQHGLPLTRADREAAVLRILESQAAWSDRAIAEVTGLSAPTVGAIRSRATANSCQSQARIGKDGRIRPLTTAEGRRAAAKIITERPDAPLREIASTAGISTGTARDVRDRLRRGDDPVPIKYSKNKVLPEPPRQASVGPDLQGLRKDPSLRFNAVARTLLQWLSICDINDDQRNNLIQGVPEYRRDNFAELALVCAERWKDLAEELRQPNRNTG